MRGADPGLFNRLSRLPDKLAALVSARKIAGVVTLLWQGGRIVDRNAIGWRDLEHGLPMRNDTIFRIASMTKPLTTAAALRLAEQGKLALADPITRWLPEFSDMQVLQEVSGSLLAVEPAHRDITVLDLMTHRSGLAYAFSATGPISRAYDAAFGEIPKIRTSPDQWLAILGEFPLLYQPGERMHYGHSTEVLGYLIQRVAGVGYYEFLHDNILAPLQMCDTAFHVPPSESSRLAKVYRAAGDSLEWVDIDIPSETPTFCAGGGMLVSTADDYLAFARMLLAGGEYEGRRILAEATVAAMRTDQLTSRQRQFPFLGKPYWSGMGFGLGLGVVTDPAKHAWMGPGNVGAFTWPGVWGTWWQADPILDAVMIYLIQYEAPLASAVVTQSAPGQVNTRPGLPLFQQAVYGEDTQ